MEKFDWGFENDPELQRIYNQEKLIWEAAEVLQNMVREEKITKSDLARALGKTPAYVSRALNGSSNLTLRTLADVAGVLNYDVAINVKKKRHLYMVVTRYVPRDELKNVTFIASSKREASGGCKLDTFSCDVESVNAAVA
jgi:transcriptional regulator with XRE-family HTH domain